MKYETYKKICKKHKVNPHELIADGNIKEILERDRGQDLEYHEYLLDNYFTIYYWEGKYADL